MRLKEYLFQLEFREAARLRQTCSSMDELVHLNAAQLRFPVSVGTDLDFTYCGRIDKVCRLFCSLAFFQPYDTWILLPGFDLEDSFDETSIIEHHPRGLECALFDNIIIVGFFFNFIYFVATYI